MNEYRDRKTFADIIIIFISKIPLWIAFPGLLRLYAAKERSSHDKTVLVRNTHGVYCEALQKYQVPACSLY